MVQALTLNVLNEQACLGPQAQVLQKEILLNIHLLTHHP